jgi:hypothetical protein
MASKTKSVDVPPAKPGEIQVNFGNVEALKLQIMNDHNKTSRRIADTLDRIDATLIRLEGKYDANQEES